MRLKVYSRLQKQQAGTMGPKLFDQDDATAFGYFLAKAAGASRNGVYEIDLFMIGMGILNRKKMKKLVNKAVIQKEVSKHLQGATSIILSIKAYERNLKKEPPATKENEHDLWEVEMDNLAYEIAMLADCNEYNPWPINLTHPILLAYLSGYRVPNLLIKSFKAWLEHERSQSTRSVFLKYFEAFIKGVESGKLDYKVLLSSSMLREYVLGLEGGTSANIEKELVRIGLVTREDVKALSFDKLLKKVAAEWKAK